MNGLNQLLIGLSLENMTVVQSRDGKVVVKGKITKMTNPNMEAQQLVRQSFKHVPILASAILPFLRQYFKAAKSSQSAYSAFLSSNLK
ncbi:MAG: hypothetical protein GY705_24145 [Bacteroidetes bacterium]|nr:hypothetical protein [Bacteroidota bacterium]